MKLTEAAIRAQEGIQADTRPNEESGHITIEGSWDSFLRPLEQLGIDTGEAGDFIDGQANAVIAFLAEHPDKIVTTVNGVILRALTVGVILGRDE